MLIRSDRHRPEDLELWTELEAADRVHGERLVRSGRTQESIQALYDFASGGPCYAGVSWGKDSVVLAHLLYAFARHIPLVHLRPTNHNPDCDSVRDAFFSAFPGQHYVEISVDYLAISPLASDSERDRETDRQWKAAFAGAARQFGGRHVSGVRAGEGFVRRMRCARCGINTEATCAPLAWWSAADVFAWLYLYDLPVHPAYAMLGAGRWPRDRLRVAEIGDTHGKGGGRREWETEYYGDVLRRLETAPR